VPSDLGTGVKMENKVYDVEKFNFWDGEWLVRTPEQ
jgi:hypothetical protein